MWFLAITIAVLVQHGHAKPVTHHHTVNLAYLTQFTCDEAAERIDPNVILNITNEGFQHVKNKSYALKVTADCKPETDGTVPELGWDYSNRMYRP